VISIYLVAALTLHVGDTMRSALPFVLAGILLAVAPPGWRAQPPEQTESVIQKLAAEIATAESSSEAVKGYAKLFKTPTPELTRQLKGLPQDGIALRAAWEEAILKGKIREDSTKLDRQVAIARFLGFVEGRLGISLPVWWEEAIHKAGNEGKGHIGPGLPKNPYHHVASGRWEFDMPNGQSISRTDDSTTISFCDETMSIPKALVDEVIGGRMSVLIEKDRCFVASHNTLGYSYPLTCLDRKTGKLLWKASVWDWASRIPGATGTWYEYVSVVGKNDRVYVIGTGVHNFYIDAFDQKTGKNVFRFANCYEAENDEKKE
jgi:hypothetical protein